MNKTPPMELLAGTLDLLILRSLLFGEAHGHAIAKHIQRTSDDALQVETGTLYPALHKLEKEGMIAARWAISDKGKRAKYYRLTPGGRRCLAAERTRWRKMSRAIGRVLESLAWSGLL